jgi:hypothetical protein
MGDRASADQHTGLFPIWVRAFGIVASALFFIVAARIFWGEQLPPTASPLPFFAYPFLVITFAGWILTLVRETQN